MAPVVWTMCASCVRRPLQVVSHSVWFGNIRYWAHTCKHPRVEMYRTCLRALPVIRISRAYMHACDMHGMHVCRAEISIYGHANTNRRSAGGRSERAHLPEPSNAAVRPPDQCTRQDAHAFSLPYVVLPILLRLSYFADRLRSLLLLHVPTCFLHYRV